MKKLVIATSLLLCNALGNAAVASTVTRPEEQELYSKFSKAFGSDLDISKEQNQKFPALLTGKFNLATGRFDDAVLFKASGDPQTDLDLLDALLSIETISVPNVLRENGVIEIEFRTGKDAISDALLVRFNRKFKAKANYSAFHSIPLSVLRKYPGVFTYSELAAPRHSRVFANDRISASAVKTLRQPWLAFFDAHSTATKKELLELEKRVDEQFQLSTR
ncbi:MAG: hypothetical protein IPK73_01730 [Candidatus Obscuribacter sp.]|nr:hypothetical protein [Candidatus Obscuribacter sp.]MBK9280280.1 hypothetical protein [Candidatus Obscuribacter sp.]